MILQAAGFKAVHVTHGAQELGKDLVARKDGQQWRFQVKLGDVGLAQWRREVQPQCEEMLYASSSHPDINRRLPTRGCVVITGSFKGGAVQAVTQYAENVKSRNLGELETWSQTNLIDLLADHLPSLGPDDFALRFGHLVGRLEEGTADIGVIDAYATSTAHAAIDRPGSLVTLALELCVAAQLLLSRGLALYAPYLLLGAIRNYASVSLSREKLSAEDKSYVAILRELFCENVTFLVQAVGADATVLRNQLLRGPDAFLTATPRALLLAELIGLAVELAPKSANENEALWRECFTMLARYSLLYRPSSDAFASSVLLVAKLYERWHGKQAARKYCLRVACHVNDRLENHGPGLPGPHEGAKTEATRLLRLTGDQADLERRNESFLLSACLDWLLVNECEEDVKLVLQDSRAVGALPVRLLPKQVAEALVKHSDGAILTFLYDLHIGELPGLVQLNSYTPRVRWPTTLKMNGIREELWAATALTRDRWWRQLL